jgi:hypothetical protein
MQCKCNKPFNFDGVTKPVSTYNFIHQPPKILHSENIKWVTRTLPQEPIIKTLYIPLHNQFVIHTIVKCEIPCHDGL